jgi:acyl carrier protein
MTTTSGTDLQTAIIRSFARHIRHDVSPEVVDCDARFFEQSGFYLGEYVLDSLSLVEVIVTLESELHMAILDSGDSYLWDSIAKLSELMLASVDAARLEAFEERCSQADHASSI